MTAEALDTACEHTRRQQEDRIVEAVAELTGRDRSYAPFYAIQARTGIPPCELFWDLEQLIEDGRLKASVGSYRLSGACPHDPAFQAMESTRCLYCNEQWP